MESYLPIGLNLSRRPCLVVGGGGVALQKVRVLIEAGAQVKVVAPSFIAAVERLEGIVREPHEFDPVRDLEGMGLAVAATNDPALNLHVWDEARRRGVLVNVVDDPEHCDFIFPSILRRGPLTVAVGTQGASPAMSRLIRQQMEKHFPPDFGLVLEAAQQLRRQARHRIPCPGARWAVNQTVARLALRHGAAGANPTELITQMELVLNEVATQ